VTILPRLLMYPAIVRLRQFDPILGGPFRIPGGRIGLWTCVVLSTGGVLSSLILFLWTPGSRSSGATPVHSRSSSLELLELA
jgi:hypothetical protein